MDISAEGHQVEGQSHKVNANLKARYATRFHVAVTSEVYVNIPGEGCSKMSAYFEAQQKRLQTLKPKLEGLELKRLQS